MHKRKVYFSSVTGLTDIIFYGRKMLQYLISKVTVQEMWVSCHKYFNEQMHGNFIHPYRMSLTFDKIKHVGSMLHDWSKYRNIWLPYSHLFIDGGNSEPHLQTKSCREKINYGNSLRLTTIIDGKLTASLHQSQRKPLEQRSHDFQAGATYIQGKRKPQTWILPASGDR